MLVFMGRLRGGSVWVGREVEVLIRGWGEECTLWKYSARVMGLWPVVNGWDCGCIL